MSEVELNSGILHYDFIKVAKSDDQFLLVFLHEALGSIPQWRSFPQKLCECLKLNGLVYERQGHGLSSALSKPRTAAYLHEYAFEELPQFLDTVVLEKTKLILVGHSDGGTIALLYASRFPEKVHGVITLAAHVVNEPETINGIGPAVEAYGAGKLEKLKVYHGEKTGDLFYAWANTWRSSQFKNWNILEELKSIKTPVLAIQGRDDQYGTSKQLKLIQNAIRSNCETLIITSCGHHPHSEQFEIVSEAIIRFLDGMNNSSRNGLN
jgi:pimeloyl-ACP methyl ester carboxylesterase